MLKNAPRKMRCANQPQVAIPAPVGIAASGAQHVGRRRLLGATIGAAAMASALAGALLAPTRSKAGAMTTSPAPMALPPTQRTASHEDRARWVAFRDRFISAEGRVIDTGNGHVSHSEGQGYGLLMAEWADDRATFERVLAWTNAHLGRPDDALFAWRWKPGQATAVSDMNSATDGDLGIAWALARGGARWGVPAWQRQATRIGRSVLALSTREVAGRLLLLPGPCGFDRPGTGKVVVNPSYYLFPAMRALAQLAPDPRWARLHEDGLWLVGAARFGRWGLSADWVEAASNGSLAPASGWPARFSWDAVRVPLYLIWAGEHGATAVNAAAAFWAEWGDRSPPGWADLASGQLAPYAGHAGIQAVAALSLAAVTGRGGAPHAAVAEAPDYYAASLALLVRVAWQEGGLPAAAAASIRVAGR